MTFLRDLRSRKRGIWVENGALKENSYSEWILDRKRAFGLKMGLLGKIDVLEGFLGKIHAVWVKMGLLEKIVLKGLKISILNRLKNQYSLKASFLTQIHFLHKKPIEKINFSLKAPFLTQTTLFYPTTPSRH